MILAVYNSKNKTIEVSCIGAGVYCLYVFIINFIYYIKEDKMWFLTKRRLEKERIAKEEKERIIKEKNERIKKLANEVMERVNSCNGVFINNQEYQPSGIIIFVIKNIKLSNNLLEYDLYSIKNGRVNKNNHKFDLSLSYYSSNAIILYLNPAPKKIQNKMKKIDLECIFEKELIKKASEVIDKLPKFGE
jgi:hypothetical protein